MFVLTLNKKSIKKICIVLGCAVMLGAATYTVATLTRDTSEEVAAKGNVVKSTEDMADYLLGYGIEAEVATAKVAKVSVPKKFDEDFIAFNEVLIASGFDLEKYKNKNADKWMMEAVNKSQEGNTTYAVLLVREDKVIGGYLLTQPSGEVAPLVSQVVPPANPDEEIKAEIDD